MDFYGTPQQISNYQIPDHGTRDVSGQIHALSALSPVVGAAGTV
jgi:hypothetical protein